MINELKKNIDKLIDECSGIDNRLERNNWKSVFEKLCDYQDKKFEEIKTNVEDELNAIEAIKNIDWHIMTALIKPDQSVGKTSAWSEVICLKNKENTFEFYKADTEKRIYCYGFMYVDYDRMSEFCGSEKKYKCTVNGQENTYSLIQSDELINYHERQIFETADIYNIQVPVIYSPWFRRYVMVVTDINVDQDNDEVDLRLHENGLDNILLPRYKAIWNVKRNKIAPNRSSISTDSNLNHNVNCYSVSTDKCQFVHFTKDEYDKYNIEFEVGSDHVAINIGSDDEIDSVELISLGKYEKFLDIKENEFENIENIPKRIVSRSDIEQVLKCFECMKIKCHSVSTERNNMQIFSYGKHYEYPDDKNTRLCLPRKKYDNIYVKFESVKPEDKFFKDKIAYVINFLNRYYPEFNWNGGF